MNQKLNPNLVPMFVPEDEVDARESLKRTLKKLGLAHHQCTSVKLGSKTGITFPIFDGKSGKLLANVYLLRTKDGAWKSKVELASWLDKAIMSALTGE